MRFLSNLIASTLGVLIALGIVFFFFFVFIFAVALSSEQAPAVRSGSVLVVPLAGGVPELIPDDPLMRAFSDGPAFDLQDLKLALRKAAADDRIEGLWLQSRGIGTSWATLEEIRTALLDFKESGKVILASSDDYYVGEDDYFLASVADSVFAAPQALFEFNGFYMMAEFYRGLLDKLDVEAQIVRAGRFKSAVEPFERTDLSAESEEQLSALMNSINTQFMQQVGQSRGIAPEKLQAIAEERAIFTAEDAYRAGLLDGLLFEDQIADRFKARLGYDDDEDLRTVSLGKYKHVSASEAGLEQGDAGNIAVVYADGGIVSGESRFEANPLFGGAVVGAETFIDAMREARESERVDAVVVRVNSPGGSAPAADAMWRAIDLTAQEKPVIVSMGGLAASGGYWISTAADTIVADPLTLTGSIGVFNLFFDVGGFFENKLGITHDAVRTSPYADMFSGLRSLAPRERALLERSVQETYQAFLRNVAEGRGLDVVQVDSIGQGRVWTGEQAQKIGLVDVLGGLETAIALAAERAGLEEGDYGIRLLPRPKTFIEELSEAMSAQARQAWLHLRTTPAERSLMEQTRLVEELLRMHGTVQARLPLHITVE